MIVPDRCDELKEIFPEYVQGELDAVEVRMVEDHLATCDGCRAEMVLIHGIVSRFGQIEEDASPPELAQRIMGRVLDDRAARRISGFFNRQLLPFRFLVPALALGAVLALVVPGWITPRDTEEPSGGSPEQFAAALNPRMLRPIWWGGNVTINEKTYDPTHAGQVEIHPGDSIRTGDGAAFSLLYPSGSSVDLTPDGRMLMKTDGVFLTEGHLAASVDGLPPGTFRVETPNTVITHLGTQFTVDVKDRQTRVEVASGRVSMNFGKVENKVVFPGQFATVTGSGTFELGTLSTAAATSQASTKPENVTVDFRPRSATK